jgi:hypothetical protein
MGGIQRVRAGSEFCSRGGHVRHLILHAVVHNSPLKSHPLPALRSHPLPALRSHPLPALKSHPLPALKSHPLPALRSHPLYQRLGPILPVLRPHPLNQRSVPIPLTSAQFLLYPSPAPRSRMSAQSDSCAPTQTWLYHRGQAAEAIREEEELLVVEPPFSPRLD